MDLGKAYTSDANILPRPMSSSTGGVTIDYQEVVQGGKSKKSKKSRKSKKSKKSKKNRKTSKK